MFVKLEILKEIAIITLIDEKHLNVLSCDLIKELNALLNQLEENDSVKVVILKSIGKVFSAGANLKEVIHYKQNGLTHDFIEEWQRLSQFSKPVITALNRNVFGGGVELILQTDIIFALDTIQISLPELSVGVIPGGGGTQRLTQLLGKGWTNYLCMAGHKLTAVDAFSLGLIQKLTKTEEDLNDDVLNLALTIARNPLSLLQEVKKNICFAFESPIQEGMKKERDSFYKSLNFKEHDECIQSFFKK